MVLGGAVMKPGSTVIRSDMKVNFGGLGSDGLRIFPAVGDKPASFTLSFGVAETFLAGTQAIQSAPGKNGLRLNYDRNTKAYHFVGDAYIDFGPTSPIPPPISTSPVENWKCQRMFHLELPTFRQIVWTVPISRSFWLSELPSSVLI